MPSLGAFILNGLGRPAWAGLSRTEEARLEMGTDSTEDVEMRRGLTHSDEDEA